MALYHVKSNPVGNATGTVTIWNTQGSTTTTPASSLVQPQDWNSAHLMGMSLSGNTAGVSSVSGTDIVMVGGNNITLSASQGASIATISFVGPSPQTPQSLYVPNQPASTNSQPYGAQGQSTASVLFTPLDIYVPIAFDALRVLDFLSFISSAGAASQTVTRAWGLYSNNNGTLSQISSSAVNYYVSVSSVSGTVSFPTSTNSAGYTQGSTTFTTTAQAQSLFGTVGNKVMDLVFGNSMSLPAGRYYLGQLIRQSTAGGNAGISGAYVGNVVSAAMNVSPMGQASSNLTASTNAHAGMQGLGAWTVTSASPPATVALTALAMTLTVQPLVTFLST